MYFVLIAVKWNTSSKADELEKNRETLENKRRKSCGPIYIKPSSSPGRKYIMQSGIGKVVLRRNSGGKTMGKNEPHNRIYSTRTASRVSFATVGFVKLGHDCDRQKFPTPPPLGRRPSRSLTVTILRNGTSISRGWRRGEEVNRKFTHTYTFERAYPASFLGLLIKIKNDLFP